MGVEIRVKTMFTGSSIGCKAARQKVSTIVMRHAPNKADNGSKNL